MLVAASTECFPDLSLPEVTTRLVDLEFSRVEIALHEKDGHLKPSEIVRDVDHAADVCRHTQRLTPIAYSVDIQAEGDEYYRQFAACCRLAKATKVVILVVRGAELGTPFNAEVERLRELVTLATAEGAVVAVKTEAGRVTADPDTLKVLCDNVNGLGVTLDPSHFVFQEPKINYESILKYVAHVHLRDTTKDQFQVRVGQGKVEYGRLIAQLAQERYERGLCVHIAPMEGVDHLAELRKLRLLLESSL
ncbi:MAG: sugar phosphate isomerase/epimerase [Planctomycetota bacterium]|nr:MAG: sugar phosphate isomerase/epimerase [Planctomycetota bacterium]REJ92753.1 MAG: sugar phosphate isomerase/epimerase [Planctomycetota bacterium]REK23791.1 MAG: sugar phosphate isomerase/epimerase [Planctomycetota bacterium]REK47644.1 MAG: sugar phosphate isomerase/epimerase [Planctomycetota bacterium]